jgi:ComF family protein
MFNQIIQWIFPATCCLCSLSAPVGREFCSVCQGLLPWVEDRCYRCGLCLETGEEAIYCNRCRTNPKAFDRLCALFSYDPPVPRMIFKLKYSGKLNYGKILGGLLADKIEKEWYKNQALPEAIIPVPLHRKRLRKRGFNQAVEIALPIKKRLRIPILYHYFLRIKDTVPQSALSKYYRFNNLKSVFRVTEKLPYQHVAIIDDVVTTGNTVSALCELLKEKGVMQIDIWCVARA